MGNSAERNEEIFDILLRNALIERYNAEAEEFCKPCGEADLSEAFERKASGIKRALGRGKNVKAAVKIIRNALIISAVIMGIFFSVILTEPKVSAAVGTVIKGFFSDHNSYSYYGEAISESEFDRRKEPRYVPKGYMLTEIHFDEYNVDMTFENYDDGAHISFRYGAAMGMSFFLDNERHNVYEITEKGIAYNYYQSLYPGETSMLLWYDEGYYYLISADLPEEELLRLAESVK